MKTTNEKLIEDAVEKISNLFSKHSLPFTYETLSDLLDGKFFAANISLPSNFLREYRDTDKTVCRVRTVFFSLFLNTNPNGVTGPKDIERTLAISIEFLGSKRRFRGKTFSDATIEKHYEFYRFGDDKNHTETINEMSEKALDFTQQIIARHIEEKETAQPIV